MFLKKIHKGIGEAKHMSRNFRVTSDGNEQDIQEIHEMLKEYNLSNREKSDNVPLGIFLEDENKKKLAGLTGETLLLKNIRTSEKDIITLKRYFN